MLPSGWNASVVALCHGNEHPPGYQGMNANSECRHLENTRLSAKCSLLYICGAHNRYLMCYEQTLNKKNKVKQVSRTTDTSLALDEHTCVNTWRNGVSRGYFIIYASRMDPSCGTVEKILTKEYQISIISQPNILQKYPLQLRNYRLL